MRVAKEELLLNKMKQGQVYRRSDLARYTAAVDRYLDRLVKKNEVVKVSGGLYLRPKVSAFGAVPPDEQSLVKTFLKDDRFLVNSFRYSSEEPSKSRGFTCAARQVVTTSALVSNWFITFNSLISSSTDSP